jgi:hypothetical protein
MNSTSCEQRQMNKDAWGKLISTAADCPLSMRAKESTSKEWLRVANVPFICKTLDCCTTLCCSLEKTFRCSSSQPDRIRSVQSHDFPVSYTSPFDSSFDLAFFASNASRLSFRTLFRRSYDDISFSPRKVMFLVVTKSMPFNLTGAIPDRFIFPVVIVFPVHET